MDMNDILDDFLEELQETIYEETQKKYGLKAYQRWKDPLFMGKIAKPDAYARVTGACGDTIEIFLKFDDHEKVVEASFLTDGCASSMICASYAAEKAIGTLSEELLEISGETILEQLPGFPHDERHCAYLAAETLHNALGNYIKKQAVI